MAKKIRNIKNSPKAQGMVEFALALPVFLLLVFGVIEFGRLLVSYSSVYTASREAARFGAAVGDSGAGVPYYQDCTGIRQAAVRVGALAGVNEASVVVRYFASADETAPFATFNSTSAVCNVTVQLGYIVAVEVTVTYQPIIPLVNLPPIPITSASSRTIVQGVDIFGTPGPTTTPRPSSNTATKTPTPTETFTPSPTYTWTPSITPSMTASNTPIPPTSTDIFEQTAIEGSHRTATKIQETIDAWNTQQAANTLTAAPLKTIEAAQTSTASSFTKTAAADCTWLQASSIAQDGNKAYSSTLSNTSSTRDAAISKIEVDWTGNEQLTAVNLGTSSLWSGNQSPHPYTINTFLGGADLSLNRGAVKKLVFTFNNLPSNSVKFKVTFNNGCIISPK